MLLLRIAAVGFAQGKGIITGQVIDQNGDPLPGANVMIKGTTQGANTDLNGNFNLRGVDAGKHEVSVSYLGYVPVTKKVDVVAGKTVIVDFKLEEGSNNLKEVVVSAVVDGQQRALNQQKAADNMMQVVSADQMGRFPDLNVAESLQRLSGVTITRARGEGAEIQLRGTPANFVNLQLNGEQVMGTNDGARNATLDVIPSDVLASLEVQKTLLPSNDGDAIAGVVNMRTATARSLDNRFAVDLGSGYNVLRKRAPMSFKLGWNKRFAPTEANPQGVFGVYLSSSYYRTYNGYDRMEAQTWAEKPLNVYNEAKGKLQATDNKLYVPLDFRYRYQEGTRSRAGATLTLDYTPSLNTSIVLSGMYTNRYEDDTRYRLRRRIRGAFLDKGDGTIGNDRVTSILQVTDQDIKVDIYNLSLDANTVKGNWKLDGGAFYSYTQKDARNAMYGFSTPDWRANNKEVKNTDNGKGKGIKIPVGQSIATITNLGTPYLNATPDYFDQNGVAYDDMSYYTYNELVNNNNVLSASNMTVRANASYEYKIMDEYASQFSFGAKGKFMFTERTKPWSSTVLTTDTGTATIKDFMTSQESLAPKFLNGNINFGYVPSLGKVQEFTAANPDYLKVNDYRTGFAIMSEYFKVHENVGSAYVMNRSQFGKLMAIIGLRAESTWVDYVANPTFRFNKAVLDLPENANKDPHYNGGQVPGADPTYNAYEATPKDSALNYTIILPNLQFKYDLNRNTILRLAYTTGYSRPHYKELVPTINVNQELEKVEMGNPALKPAYANNFDLLFEHFLSRVGLISGGVFYKNIDKFLYMQQGTITDPNNPYWNPADGADQMTMVQYQNGKTANVYGAELTLNSALTFLPSILKNLVFTGNYTYTHSKAHTETRGDMRFPGQANHTANCALAYSDKKFTIQASLNYNGKFMYAMGASAEEDLWVDGRYQLDANASYTIVKGLNIYAEATNLLNTKAYTFMGNKNRSYEVEYTGEVFRAGISYKF